MHATALSASAGLLDIAALKQRPAKVFLQLIGVVESRHALAQRIRRIVSQPIPKSAKLGFAGFAAIALVGTLLLPMFIHPDECIDCGACEPECPVDAIFPEDDLPAHWHAFHQANADLAAEHDG